MGGVLKPQQPHAPFAVNMVNNRIIDAVSAKISAERMLLNLVRNGPRGKGTVGVPPSPRWSELTSLLKCVYVTSKWCTPSKKNPGFALVVHLWN